MTQRNKLIKDALRYLVGGLSTTLLTWGCVWGFVEIFGVHYLISANLATAVAYFYSYFVNKVLVFKDTDSNHVIKGSKFLGLQLSLLALTNVFLLVTVSQFGIDYMLSVIVISVINAVVSFTVMRQKVFSRQV